MKTRKAKKETPRYDETEAINMLGINRVDYRRATAKYRFARKAAEVEFMRDLYSAGASREALSTFFGTSVMNVISYTKDIVKGQYTMDIVNEGAEKE